MPVACFRRWGGRDNTVEDRNCPRLLCRGTKESYSTVQMPRAIGSLPVCPSVKPTGEPDALIGHVRFDERGWETERCRIAQATAPILDSTIASFSCSAIIRQVWEAKRT